MGGTTVMWVLVALFVGANWWSRIRGDGRLELISKPLATVAIAGLGLVVSDGAPGGAVVAGMIGFLFCLIGDVALLPQVDKFVVGLGAFLVGHLAFVGMFIALGLDRWALSLIILGVIAAMSPFIVRRVIAGAAAKDSSLKVPVIAYFGVITAMAATGWSTGLLAAVIGTTLFVISDSVLGWREFVSGRPWMPFVVMSTYHGALLGLALSLA